MTSAKTAQQCVLFCVILLGAVLPLFIMYLISLKNGASGLNEMYQPGPISTLKMVNFSIFEQLVICLVSFGFKPLYELLALIIVIKTWKASDPGTVALRYGLIGFFVGENACALNYLFFEENSFILEYLHLYGMMVCFSFVCYSILITLDRKILKYSDITAKCRLNYFCRLCYKYNDVPCTIARLYQVSAIAMILISLLPLTSHLGGYFVRGDIFGSIVIFGHSPAQQILETRIYPIIAIIFFAMTWLILKKRKEKGFAAAKAAIAIGFGAFGFSLMRFIAFYGFERNPLWANIWEETTEFIFIVSVFYLLFMSRAQIPGKAHRPSDEV